MTYYDIETVFMIELDMKDFFYPLPKHKLNKRFRRLFEVIKSRQSGSFIGLPESAKSGYLQFLLYEKDIIKTIIPDYCENHKIFYFEPIPIITDNPYHWLFQLSVNLEMFDRDYKHVNTEDPVILMTNIQKYILNLFDKKKHITFLISSPNVWDELPTVVSHVWKSIWEVMRKPPVNPCSLIFLLHSKNPSLEEYPGFYERLKIIMSENCIYFPTLDREDSLYTINRFAYFTKLKIKSGYKEEIYSLTGGFYPLITHSIKVLASMKVDISNKILKSLGENSIIEQHIILLWRSIADTQRAELKKSLIKPHSNCESTLYRLGILDQKGEIRSIWIRDFVKSKKYLMIDKADVTIRKYLKGKEYLVYKRLYFNIGNLVTRDEIADALWGKKATEKYSDWAIDKTISRIRKKLKKYSSGSSLITIKDKGYILVD